MRPQPGSRGTWRSVPSPSRPCRRLPPRDCCGPTRMRTCPVRKTHTARPWPRRAAAGKVDILIQVHPKAPEISGPQGYRTHAELGAYQVRLRPALEAPTNQILETLRRDFGGDHIEPGATEYETASRSLFPSGSPAHILRPKSVRHMQPALRFSAPIGPWPPPSEVAAMAFRASPPTGQSGGLRRCETQLKRLKRSKTPPLISWPIESCARVPERLHPAASSGATATSRGGVPAPKEMSGEMPMADAPQEELRVPPASGSPRAGLHVFEYPSVHKIVGRPAPWPT